MPSPAQYAANRFKTLLAAVPPPQPEPKQRVRSTIDAVRHGPTARVVVLPTEEMAAYTRFSQEIVDSLHPETPLERQFAQTVADNQWRINRIRSIEDGMLAMGHFESPGDFPADHAEIHSAMTAAGAFRDHSQAFVNLSIYEQRLHRSMNQALRQLKELQTERRESVAPASGGADGLAVCVADPKPVAPAILSPVNLQNGFVYSNPEIAAVAPAHHPQKKEPPPEIPLKNEASAIIA